MLRVLCLLLLALGGTARSLAAQQQSTATGAPVNVRPGEAVWVTTSSGELSGKVVSVSVSTLDVSTANGRVPLPFRDISRIETRDSLKNGVRNGALIGAVSLGIYVGGLSYSLRCERDCGAGYSATRDAVEHVAFGVGAGAGGGALIGLLVDRLIKGRRVVYSAAPKASPSWQIWPTAGRGRLEINAAVHWP